MRKSVFIVLFVLLALDAAAQYLPRIAVVPFNPIGVSQSEASIITNLFETALVQTENFNVIEQNQIADIMEAQAYSMSGCTDESCAIEVGKLLAAEQIVLGELSAIGGKIILNARIIDVQQGRNLKADKVEAAGMGDMTGAAELLAFKLAGLTYTTGGTVQVAQEFGEAMIETTPAGADIYINGVKKGVSPDLITRIPLGTIRIEAKLGNLYAVEEYKVTSATAKISLALEVQFGNMFIKSTETSVEVFLDAKSLGSLGTGFFDNLPAGDHSLELVGDDVYWSGDIYLEADKSTKIDAYPRGVGCIEYSLPEGAEAEVTGVDLREILRGSGSIRLYTGEFQVSVTGDMYRDWNERISIRKGQVISFAPNMAFTEEYLKKMEEERRASLYAALSTEIESREAIVLPGYRILPSDISALADLGDRLSNSEFLFPELIKRWEALNTAAAERYKIQVQLDGCLAQRFEIETNMALLEKARKNHITFGWLSAGAGTASAVLSIASFILSWAAYQEYCTADEDSWQDLQEQYEMWDTVGYVSAGAAALTGGLTPLFWTTGPKDKDSAALISRLAEVNAEITKLKTALE